MARVRVAFATIGLTAAVLVAACSALIANSVDPTSTSLSTGTTLPILSPTASASALASPSPDVSPQTCSDFFTPPPYDAFRPVPGISIRAIDKTHVEITNATNRTYYVGVSYWVTEDNLVCGRGVIEHDNNGGRLRPGATIERGGGSTPEIPMTVAIWADPCGEGCYRDPLGVYVVPVSTVEPPVPVST